MRNLVKLTSPSNAPLFNMIYIDLLILNFRLEALGKCKWKSREKITRKIFFSSASWESGCDMTLQDHSEIVIFNVFTYRRALMRSLFLISINLLLVLISIFKLKSTKRELHNMYIFVHIQFESILHGCTKRMAYKYSIYVIVIQLNVIQLKLHIIIA